MDKKEQFYSANQVAKMLNRSVNTICFHAKKLGIGKTTFKGFKTYMITEEDIEQIKRFLRKD